MDKDSQKHPLHNHTLTKEKRRNRCEFISLRLLKERSFCYKVTPYHQNIL